MGIRSDEEIYQALEERLRKDSKPITCVELMDDPKFRRRLWPNTAATCV